MQPSGNDPSSLTRSTPAAAVRTAAPEHVMTLDLPVQIVAVVSNHRKQEELVQWHGIPFFHLPVTADTKPEAEAGLLELVDALDVELVVLARYMQVLSDELSARLAGRTINIHHSFLPSFKEQSRTTRPMTAA